MVVEFLTFLPMQIIRFIRSGKFPAAFGVFFSFGMIVGTILGVFRGKWSWAWTTALGAWAILFVWTLIVSLFLKIYRQRVKD